MSSDNYTVVIVSEEYGKERFPNLTLKEAILTIKNLLLYCEILDDGVERIIGIELFSPEENDDPIPLLPTVCK